MFREDPDNIAVHVGALVQTNQDAIFSTVSLSDKNCACLTSLAVPFMPTSSSNVASLI
jgi:hypothetical protein